MVEVRKYARDLLARRAASLRIELPESGHLRWTAPGRDCPFKHELV